MDGPLIVFRAEAEKFVFALGPPLGGHLQFLGLNLSVQDDNNWSFFSPRSTRSLMPFRSCLSGHAILVIPFRSCHSGHAILSW